MMMAPQLSIYRAFARLPSRWI